MKVARDGQPEPGRTARTLGARPGVDIPVDADGFVHGGHGGVSRRIRRIGFRGTADRPSHGGTGKDSVWELAVARLGEKLVYRHDPLMPALHGFVEPAFAMSFEEYEAALAATRRDWRLL